MATKKMRTAIRTAQQGQLLVDEFETGITGLSEEPVDEDDRRSVVDAILELMDGLYVHLPLKRAMYGKDPVQRLRLLKQRSDDLSYEAFHAEITKIFAEMRDAHTRYYGPTTRPGQVAALPFMVESYETGATAHFVVSNVIDGDPAIDDPRFEAGVEITMWNAVPIARAVDQHADRETGGRPDARRARALESLTFRALQYGPPPDELWVQIGFRALDGTELEIKIDWRVVDVGLREEREVAEGATAMAFAADPASEAVRRAKKLLFAPEVWFEHVSGEAKAVAARRSVASGEWLTGRFQDNVAAMIAPTSADPVGYLRLWSFDLIDHAAFMAEVIDLLNKLPDRGLIVDVRGNPGGLIWAAERLLQLFTPNEITPTSFSWRATDLTRAMADAPQNGPYLDKWRRSLDLSVSSGDVYSRSIALTPDVLCNDVGQRYGGPVACVVDANTYSAGDLFAAGFVDNRIGPVVSTGRATGGGGANVWQMSLVRNALAGTKHSVPPLPMGVGLSISVRRAVRSGAAAGTVIEDIGVPGHVTHKMTKDDLTERNVDLIDYCGRLLASEPVSSMEVEHLDPQSVRLRVDGIDRVDVYADMRPIGSLDVSGAHVDAELPASWSQAMFLGYSGYTLRQRRIVRR